MRGTLRSSGRGVRYHARVAPSDPPFPQPRRPREDGNCFKSTRRTLPQEPTLISKVRIHFADFPYSHCSNWSEAFNLGDLLRITVRSRMERNQTTGFPCVPWRSAQTEVCPAASSASRSLVYVICGTQELSYRSTIRSTALERKANSSAATITLRQLLLLCSLNVYK